MGNGLGRVRSGGEGVGELLDQGGGELQFLLLSLVREFVALPVAHVKLVMDEQAAVLDSGLMNIDIAHGQRVGQRVEEGRRIGRLDDHDRVGGGGVIVEADLHRLKQRREGPAAAAQHFHQTAVDPAPDVLKAGLVQQPDDQAQLVDQLLLFLRSEPDMVERPDAKEIDDLLAAQAGAGVARAAEPASCW